jgi:hypothetical protein
MSRAWLQLVDRAMDGSAVVAFLGRLAAGSIIGGAVAGAPAWIRRTRRGIAAGLGGSYSEAERLRAAESLDALCRESRAVAALGSMMTAPAIAWRTSRLSSFQTKVADLALPQKIRALGLILGVATLTHIVVFGVLQVQVQTLGWMTRASLALISLFLMSRPNLVSAAWHDRSERAAASQNARKS